MRTHVSSRLPGLGLAAALLTASAGCFQYVPADVSAVPEGTSARIVMTRMGGEQLREAVPDTRDGAPVRGTVVGTDNGDLLLNVPVAQRQVGSASRTIQQRVRIPVGEIVSFERRELNTTATVLTIGAGTAAVIGLVFAITESRKGDNPDPPDPPDDAIVEIPILSILFGR